MENIDLFLDDINELEFSVKVEGSQKGDTSCRLLIEDTQMSLGFTGTFNNAGQVSISIPEMKHCLKEGSYKAKLEVLVDDRIFKPLSFNINFKNSILVTAESATKVSKRATASAKLLTNSKVKSPKFETILQIKT